MERLSYGDFKRQLLYWLAIVSEADMAREVPPEEVVANIEGRYPQSWMPSAVNELRNEGKIDEVRYIGDKNLRITGDGLEVAESYAHEIGVDLYEEIDAFADADGDEPRRVCRRLQLLSRMEHHEQDDEQVFP